jgi:hypothetical protein
MFALNNELITIDRAISKIDAFIFPRLEYLKSYLEFLLQEVSH